MIDRGTFKMRNVKRKYCYQIYASGYGTRKYCFDSEEECLKEMRQDAECLAAEMEGDVQPYDDKELTVYGPDGDEIARFEALFESAPKWRKINEETYEDRVNRGYNDAVSKYRAKRQRIKDRITDIVGDEKSDEVFEYWDRIKSGFNQSWTSVDGFKGDCYEHLDRLSDILGRRGRDIIEDIQADYDRQDKSMRDYYGTHEYTGD
jgi:hypothetical protein